MPEKSLFSRRTFQYFDEAKKNNRKATWFPAHQDEYEANVREPMSVFVRELDHRVGHRLPSIPMSARRISRPLRSVRKAEKWGLVRASSSFYFAEPSTSRFEWNPGLFLQLGDEKEDNIMGAGLYGPSSRQIKRLRAAFLEDYETVDRILADRKLKKYWGGPAPEKYVRFPKDFSPDHPAAKYLWYKQFHLSQNFTRKEVTSKEFADTALRSFEAALPFLGWVRNAIGTYDRKEWERQRADELGRAGELEMGMEQVRSL